MAYSLLPGPLDGSDWSLRGQYPSVIPSFHSALPGLVNSGVESRLMGAIPDHGRVSQDGGIYLGGAICAGDDQV